MLRIPAGRMLAPLQPWRRTMASMRKRNRDPRDTMIDVNPEVQEALSHRKPVVALETTIVTHGMPQPTNLETARAVEAIVRENGAIPATIGIIGGRIKIGLTPQELERLADVESNPNVVKVASRDLGPNLALGLDGGTTFDATLWCARQAQIKVGFLG